MEKESSQGYFLYLVLFLGLLNGFDILVHFGVRYLGIQLGGGNGVVSHHASDRLYRHTEREGDVGPEIMHGLIVGQIKAIELAQLSCQCYKISTIVNIEYLVPGSLRCV